MKGMTRKRLRRLYCLVVFGGQDQEFLREILRLLLLEDLVLSNL